MTPPNIWICSALVGLGICFHFLTKLQELESQGTELTPWQYWRRAPYTSITVIVGAYTMLVLLWTVDQMTYSACLLLGIAANSAGDKLRAHAEMLEDDAMGAITVQRKVFIKDAQTIGDGS